MVWKLCCVLNSASLLQPLGWRKLRKQKLASSKQGFRLYDPGAYAPGFGLIPPRLGLWARPLDGPDFSLARVVPIRGCPSPPLLGWEKLDNLLILPHVMVQIFDDCTVDHRSAFTIFKGVKF